MNSLKRHYSLQWVRSDDKKFIFVCLKDYNKLSWSVRNWAVSVSNHHCWKKQTHHSSKFTCLSGVSGFLYSQKPLKIDKCVLIVLYSTEEVHPKSFDAELLFIFFYRSELFLLITFIYYIASLHTFTQVLSVISFSLLPYLLDRTMAVSQSFTFTMCVCFDVTSSPPPFFWSFVCIFHLLHLGILNGEVSKSGMVFSALESDPLLPFVL